MQFICVWCLVNNDIRFSVQCRQGEVELMMQKSRSVVIRKSILLLLNTIRLCVVLSESSMSRSMNVSPSVWLRLTSCSVLIEWRAGCDRRTGRLLLTDKFSGDIFMTTLLVSWRDVSSVNVSCLLHLDWYGLLNCYWHSDWNSFQYCRSWRCIFREEHSDWSEDLAGGDDVTTSGDDTSNTLCASFRPFSPSEALLHYPVVSSRLICSDSRYFFLSRSPLPLVVLPHVLPANLLVATSLRMFFATLAEFPSSLPSLKAKLSWI